MIQYLTQHNNTYFTLCSYERYDNDLDFIYKIDKLINLKNNYDTYQSFDNKSDVYFLNDIINIVQSNINYYINKETTQKYKEFFWNNKNKDHFLNNKINISIHIRRSNIHDNRISGTQTPNDY